MYILGFSLHNMACAKYEPKCTSTIPDNATINNTLTPSVDTGYYYNSNESLPCTFRCNEGYEYNNGSCVQIPINNDPVCGKEFGTCSKWEVYMKYGHVVYGDSTVSNVFDEKWLDVVDGQKTTNSYYRTCNEWSTSVTCWMCNNTLWFTGLWWQIISNSDLRELYDTVSSSCTKTETTVEKEFRLHCSTNNNAQKPITKILLHSGYVDDVELKQFPYDNIKIINYAQSWNKDDRWDTFWENGIKYPHYGQDNNYGPYTEFVLLKNKEFKATINGLIPGSWFIVPIRTTSYHEVDYNPGDVFCPKWEQQSYGMDAIHEYTLNWLHQMKYWCPLLFTQFEKEYHQYEFKIYRYRDNWKVVTDYYKVQLPSKCDIDSDL